MNRDQGEALLIALGVPKSKRDQVWSIVQNELQQYNTPEHKEELRREALVKATLWAPLKGLAHGAAAGLGIQYGGDLISPHAEVFLNPAIRRTMQSMSKKYNLGDMRKGPLFPVFTALGTSGLYTAKELINYHKRKKRGDFDF
jgi:hypothetical protein